eukprot:Lithocolla_globosa_v1_NODE_804_length_3254_cov_7.646765.p3 type:complete len:155 gc:universal NODE_804_length_3254_cov_7.646765:2412-2876(+)
MIGRASRRAQGLDFLIDKFLEFVFTQNDSSLLEKKSLVGRAASLCHHQEIVLRGIGPKDVNLSRKVCLCVDFLEHRKRGRLGVTQTRSCVCIIDAMRQVLLILSICPHILSSFAHNNGRARVLTARQDHSRSDVRIFDEFQSHETIIGRSLGVS